MASPAANPQVIRFGAYEVDLRTGELRKHGLRIKLQDQPFQILAMLLDRPGELVTREQIKERLWPSETFVDFDHSVNTAIRRLRDALSDAADHPRYVETLPRRGYRFIAEIQAERHEAAEVIPISAAASDSVPEAPAQSVPFPLQAAGRKNFRWWTMTAGVAILAVMAILVWRFWPQPNSIDSVAVLPFAAAGQDVELGYLSEGLAEGVIDSLSELPQLKVMSRNSAFQYGRSPVRPQEVARALGVKALVMGSLRKTGDNIHLSVELIDAREDRHLWGKEYDLKSDQLAGTPAGVVADLAAGLRQQLTAEVQAHIAHRQTRSGLAYVAYLRGRYALNSRRNENFRTALQHFQDAVDADPQYAVAYSGMSAAYGLLSFYGGMPALEALKLSESAADRALQLDPSLPEGHVNRGFALENLHRDVAAAEREMRRAVELSPNSADAHHALALVLCDENKFDEAVAESRRSAELDPLWAGNRSTTGWILYYAGRYDESLHEENVFPREFSPAHWSRGLTDLALRRYDDALREFDSADSSAPLVKCQKASAYAVMGRSADARKMLAELLAERKNGYVSAYNIATIYAGLNEPGPMMQWLRTADLESDSWLPRLHLDPRFSNFRSLPEFQQLQQRISTPR